jgi:transposase
MDVERDERVSIAFRQKQPLNRIMAARKKQPAVTLAPAPAPELFPDGTDFLQFSGAFFARGDDGKPICTGISLEKRGIAESILERIVAGASQREVAIQYHVSRNTIAALVARAEQAGVIEPLKRRVSANLGRIIEGAMERYAEALESGDVPPATIPVAVGIFIDKKQLLDGEATSRVESLVNVNVSHADVMAFLDGLPPAKASAVTIEGASNGSEHK